jgi:uncharacterized protein
MEFFDCNCWVGLPQNGLLQPAPTPADLLAAMDQAGVARALAWHVAQRDWSVVDGNQMLADAIAPHADRLCGCWTLLPEATGELPPPPLLVRQMAAANIRAVRVFPARNNYLLRAETVGGYLEEFSRRRVPLILSLEAVPWPNLYDLLKDFPALTAIVADVGLWGPDRYVRPLIERYPNVHLEISQYIVDGGLEAFVSRYGTARLLFGSGFPIRDHGSTMLMLKHAKLDDAARAAIAGGNLQRLLDAEELAS